MKNQKEINKAAKKLVENALEEAMLSTDAALQLLAAHKVNITSPRAIGWACYSLYSKLTGFDEERRDDEGQFTGVIADLQQYCQDKFGPDAATRFQGGWDDSASKGD